MNEKDFIEKRLEDLKEGDIFDRGELAYAFGWRYHILRSDAKICPAGDNDDEEVHFDCAVWKAKEMGVRNREFYSWSFGAKRTERVRVYVGNDRENLKNERVDDGDDE